MPTDKLTILVDSREKHPFIFKGHKMLTMNLGAIGADYTLRGFSKYIGVERKSFVDFMNSVTQANIDRFKKSLDRLRKRRYNCIIVEGHPMQASAYRGIAEYSPEWAINSAVFLMTYGVPVLFAGSREMAQHACLMFFKNAKERILDR